jgi:ATP-binding cassette, subfamily B, bacterial
MSTVSELIAPTAPRRLSRLPGLVRRAVVLLWAAAPRQFALTAGLQAFAGVGLGVQLLVGRQVLADLTSDGATVGDVAVPLVALAAATMLVTFANVARGEHQRLLTELVGRYATDKVLHTATVAPLIAFEQAEFHNRLERARVNAVLRPVNVSNGLIGLISSACAIAGIATALLVLTPLFLIVVVLAYIPSWLVGARSSRVIHQYASAQTERDRRRGYLLMVLTGRSEAQEVRAFNLGAFLRDRHADLYDERIDGLRAVVRRRLRLGLVGAAWSSTLTATALATLVWFVLTGRMDVAGAGAAAAGVVVLGQRLQAIASAAAALYEGALFLEDFTTFVDASTETAPADRVTTAPRGFLTLSARDVRFQYPGAARPALRGVSMDLRAGEVVALVGLNGSGKTTLAKLLAGLYEPDEGHIRWDDVDAATCDPRELRESVSVIFQDFVRYQLSVNANIAFGRHSRYDDEAAVRAAAERAGAHTLIDALQDGYATRLGPQFLGGSDLSAGQWQRIALARALFRDTPFVILDEPTASLDPQAEAALFTDIRAMCRARSVLLITHRLSSVRTVDRILVLRDGEIVEQGTHAELLARDGHYAELYRVQADRYVAASPVLPGRAR